MLGAIDADDVESISDTEEAGMCVDIANRCYENLITHKRTWRHLRKFSTLSTTTALNELVLPSGTLAMDPYSLYYEGQRVYWKAPDEFLWFTEQRDVSESNVELQNNIKVYNDRNPQFFTTDDDETLRFDAMDDSDGLDGSLAKCILYQMPTSELTSDTQYFDLPHQIYPAFIQYCIGTAVLELQMNEGKAGVYLNEYKRELARLSRTARLIDVYDDVRKFIIPRSTHRNMISPLRNTGSGWV